MAEDTPAWLSIEQGFCQRTSLSALLNSAVKTDRSLYGGNFNITLNSLKIWKQIKIYFKAPDMYVDSPICNTHTFKPAREDAMFAHWKNKGVVYLKDLYLDGHFMSFDQLRHKFDFPASHFFRYLQIRNFMRSHLPKFADMPQHYVLEQIINVRPGSRGAVSVLHQSLMEQEEVTTEKFRVEWETELGLPIS